jgi:phosphohistidine phosphatase
MEVRNICFVRHAKSNWDHPGLADFDRPLDKRGLHDAPMMAKKMKELHLNADFIITSGANRAKSTAEFFKKEFDIPADHFVVNNRIYEAAPETIFSVIRETPDTARFLYVFGHNPTFTWVANSISGVHIDNVPTCGIVHVQAMLTSWSQFKPEYAGFIGFHYPKQY